MASVVLITGGSGLIGRHVLDAWPAGDLTPVVVDRREDDLLEPGTARGLVQRFRPQAVLHLAWTASGTPGYRTSEDNERWVATSLELAEACATSGARLFATGTGVDRSQPTDLYTAAKVRLRHALAGQLTAGSATWLRAYYVVDPARRRPALLAHALQARHADEPVVLRTPYSAHDFVHAADVGRAIALAVSLNLTGEVPIGSGRLRTVRELVEALGVRWRTADGPPAPVPHSHDVADISALRARGWTPYSTEELFHDD